MALLDKLKQAPAQDRPADMGGQGAGVEIAGRIGAKAYRAHAAEPIVQTTVERARAIYAREHGRDPASSNLND
jgi:hypothetical protein